MLFKNYFCPYFLSGALFNFHKPPPQPLQSFKDCRIGKCHNRMMHNAPRHRQQLNCNPLQLYATTLVMECSWNTHIASKRPLARVRTYPSEAIKNRVFDKWRRKIRRTRCTAKISRSRFISNHCSPPFLSMSSRLF